MKPAFESTSHQETRHRAFSGSALARTLCFALVLLANHATASVIYRMVGGVCTDSNAPLLTGPDGDVAGPKACADNVSVEVTVRDDYVPGTQIDYSGFSPNGPSPVESISYNDGARSIVGTVPPSLFSVGITGSLPAELAQSVFSINFEPWGFHTNPDGTWYIAIESVLSPDVRCNIESTEGPGGCVMIRSTYEALGTYEGWQRVPEPATLGLFLLALGVMGGLHSRARAG